MSAMTNRERMLAVVRGEMPDRVPFAQYCGGGGPDEEIWAAIGREKMGLLAWVRPHRFENEKCTVETEPIERDGLAGTRSVMHTPAGELTSVSLSEPVLNSSHIAEHFVQTPADYRVLLEFLHDVNVVPDEGAVEAMAAKLGDDGLPHTCVARTPFQQLWVQWVSIENLCLHMVDEPELMDEVIGVLAEINRRAMRLAVDSPAPYIVFPDNVTAPIIGEQYFRKHCVPHYDELAAMLSDETRPVFVHMDGDLLPIADAIAGSGIRGMDSFSPPPDNDTSVAEAIARWPGMRIWANFPSSVHLAPPEAIYAKARELLEEGGHTGQLQIQISENVPPGRWKVSYPEIVRAIEDYSSA